ncbi:MAG: CotH kinase family protein [Bacteroidales bacterium]|nr:CotH kinase family protein [Bacteroidales bacterium]
MNRYTITIIGLVMMLCGCQDSHSTESPEKTDLTLTIKDVKTDTGSITLTLYATGEDKDEYIRWGVTYGESDDKTLGKGQGIDGSPAEGSGRVTIDGLKDNTTYYIWGWAYDKGGDRVWAENCITAKTKVKPQPKPAKLSGTIIGSTYSVDYNNGNAKSTTVNTKDNVFDGNFETYFASYDRSGTWVGYDLGTEHVITKIGYSPRITQSGRVELAMIEGANMPDFSDAIPIHMIKKAAPENQMTYEETSCSRGFRYVRYVSPYDVRCNLAELEFYGYASEGNDSKLYQITNLPTIIINTPGAQEIVSKEEELSCNVYIISEGGTNLLATSETGVRGRGNASWDYFEKKPYRIKFDKKQSPLGAPASAKKWTLLSNYGDKTLMRNILAFEVSRRVGMAYTPYCQPVDLVVNGEYRGCYQFCDQVEAREDRVPAKDGYLIEIDSYAWKETSCFWSWKGTPVTIKHPDEDEITAEQRSHIENFFNQMESASLGTNFKDPQKGYRKYIDVESFLRNIMVGDFSGNPDLLWSMFMYKDAKDGKLYAGPTWDHDLSFDNDYRVYSVNDKNDFLYLSVPSPASDAVRELTDRIVKQDPYSRQMFADIWREVYENGTLKSLPDYVDQTARLLAESQELNFKRWKILGHKVHMNFQALGTYEAEVEFMKNCLEERLIKFDQYVKNNN